MDRECPNCFQVDGWEEGQYFDQCKFCGYEEDKRIPLYVPSFFSEEKIYLDLSFSTKNNPKNVGYWMSPNLFPKKKGGKRPGSYRFHFYASEVHEEHKGIHLHVEGDGKMDIWIDELNRTCSLKGKPHGINEPEQRKILRFVKDNIDYIIQEWNKRKNQKKN